MMRWLASFVLAVVLAAPGPAVWARTTSGPSVAVAQLPGEARETLARIERGGPYRYERDGVVFGNYERYLPARNRGYYREYTVATPGLQHRGARRLVVGCERTGSRNAGTGGSGEAGFAALRECAGPAEVYYTDDHYRSFKRVVP